MTDVDMTRTVIPKSDQLNADDLIAGPRTIKITSVSASNTPDQPVSIGFDGDGGRPWKPCKSMRRVLIALWGARGSGYVGKRVTLYRDESVKFGGIEVGGIRISHADIDSDMTIALTTTRGKRAPSVVRKLAPPVAQAVTLSDVTAALKAAGRNKAESFAWLTEQTGAHPTKIPPEKLAELLALAKALTPPPEPGSDG
jgi:hypothetical protein